MLPNISSLDFSDFLRPRQRDINSSIILMIRLCINHRLLNVRVGQYTNLVYLQAGFFFGPFDPPTSTTVRYEHLGEKNKI